jgi:hypothetical protein
VGESSLMLDDVLCQLQATQHNIELVQALHSKNSSPFHLGTSPVQVVRVLISGCLGRFEDSGLWIVRSKACENLRGPMEMLERDHYFQLSAE